MRTYFLKNLTFCQKKKNLYKLNDSKNFPIVTKLNEPYKERKVTLIENLSITNIHTIANIKGAKKLNVSLFKGRVIMS